MSKDKEIDPFRDTPLRYMGYANEVGESFRPLVSRNIVTASYVVAFGYVFADTFFKAYKEKQNSEGSSNKWEKVMICAGDSFIWQTLASVFIPGFTINRIHAEQMNPTSSPRRVCACNVSTSQAINQQVRISLQPWPLRECLIKQGF